MLKNNKILISFLLFTILFFSISNICFADSNNIITWENKTINLSQFASGSNDTGLLLYDKINDKFVLYGIFAGNHGACLESTKYYIKIDDDDYISFGGCCEHTYFGNYYLFNYDIENGCVTSLIDSKPFNQAYGSDKISKNQYTFVYKNVPIYKDDTYVSLTESDFFFNTVLAPITQNLGLETILQEIIIVLPMILVVVVSYLGLRKALQMLSTLLHR